MQFTSQYFSIIPVDTHRRDDHALDYMLKEYVHGEARAERSDAGLLTAVVPDHPAIVAKAQKVIEAWAI